MLTGAINSIRLSFNFSRKLTLVAVILASSMICYGILPVPITGSATKI